MARNRLEKFRDLPDVRRHKRLERLCASGPPTPDEFGRWALQSRITRLLMGNLPDFLVIKGQPLAVQTLDAPARRWTSDIDILVQEQHIADATAGLKSLGFEPKGVLRPWAYNQQTFLHPNWPIPVELHWRLALPFLPCQQTENLFERRQWVRVGAVDVPTLGAEDTVISLALHLAQHLGELRVAIDLAGFLDRNPVDLDLTRTIAHDVGLSRILEIALLIADPGLISEEPLAPIVAEHFWHAWEDGAQLSDSKWALYLTQCATAALLDHQKIPAFSQALILGPHRTGTILGQFIQRNSKNYFHRLTHLRSPLYSPAPLGCYAQGQVFPPISGS